MNDIVNLPTSASMVIKNDSAENKKKEFSSINVKLKADVRA